jgi:formylglycine-generating enzyme required for sulfatase activity
LALFFKKQNMFKTPAFILAALLWGLANDPAAAQNTRTGTIPGSGVSFDMVLVPGGNFHIGSAPSDVEAQPNEQPHHLVRVDSFWMGTHEITYDEFIVFYHRENDSDTSSHPAKNYKAGAISRPTPQYIDYTYGMGKEGFPVVAMTQQAALRYCYWLYEKTGTFYRLPTEAEWEYACKKGLNDDLTAGHLSDYAWYYGNSFEKYHEAGTRKPNALGIYDMFGNVAEWTLDYYDEDYLKNLSEMPALNPWVEPTRKHSRTVKGGSYDSDANECRCAFRQKSDPRWQARDPQIPKSRWWNPDSPFVGFRLVSPVKLLTEAEVQAFFKKAIKE